MENTEAVIMQMDLSAVQADLDAYRAACRDQGLPEDCPIDRFVEHHRGNAAVAAAAEALVELSDADRVISHAAAKILRVEALCHEYTFNDDCPARWLIRDIREALAGDSTDNNNRKGN